MATLVISAQQKNAAWMRHFECQQQQVALERKVATIHVVAEKKKPIVDCGFGCWIVAKQRIEAARHVKQFHEIKVLAVDVAAN